MRKQMFDRLKKILSIFATLFFVVSMTARAVISLAYNVGIEFTNKRIFQKWIWTINW